MGKTTLLDAIGLLLGPGAPIAASDTDYHGRDYTSGFVIEAVISLPATSAMNDQVKPAWPWDWNGSEAVVPTIEEGATQREPVYCLRVRGTDELDLVHEIVQPDGSSDPLRIGLRRAIGLVQLGGNDHNDRDLRLVQGSALDRLLSDKGLRSRLTTRLAQIAVQDDLTDDAKARLQTLDSNFRKRHLPSGLDLAVTGSQGMSVSALVGLRSEHDDVQLPLACWGSGTRRLVALAISEENQTGTSIATVDELERGLEPYRQRSLIQSLQSRSAQVFVTTHSPIVIASATEADTWYLDAEGRIGQLDGETVAAHRARDPQAYLSRLTIVGEGTSEVGFLRVLLEKGVDGALESHGIHITDGGGHETVLELLEALRDGGLVFGGFVDNEQNLHEARWTKLAASLGDRLFRWSSGCLEENILRHVPDDKLEVFIEDPQGKKTGARLRTLADRLDSKHKDLDAIRTVVGDQLKQLVLEAALGTVPPEKESEKKAYRKHGQHWFKTLAGGQELAQKVFSLGVWPRIQEELLPFCNAIRRTVGQADLSGFQ
ncbi:MAG: AAA family ATPase [Polyangiaceae bacterium]